MTRLDRCPVCSGEEITFWAEYEKDGRERAKGFDCASCGRLRVVAGGRFFWPVCPECGEVVHINAVEQAADGRTPTAWRCGKCWTLVEVVGGRLRVTERYGLGVVSAWATEPSRVAV